MFQVVFRLKEVEDGMTVLQKVHDAHETHAKRQIFDLKVQRQHVNLRLEQDMISCMSAVQESTHSYLFYEHIILHDT